MNYKTYEVRVYKNGGKHWYLNGKLHREDGPAVEYSNGDKQWYLNDKRHREDGPAVEHVDGYKSWWLNGKRHRKDGPAVEYSTGGKAWYLNDNKYTEEEFRKQIELKKSPTCSGKVIEFEGKRYELKEVKPKTSNINKLKDNKDVISKTSNLMRDICYGLSKDAGWYDKPVENGTRIALIHSEISEALEGLRKDMMDDHLTERKMVEVEMADAVIRIMDFCGSNNLDIGGAIVEKLVYNTTREDHKKEVRSQKGGKAF